MVYRKIRATRLWQRKADGKLLVSSRGNDIPNKGGNVSDCPFLPIGVITQKATHALSPDFRGREFGPKRLAGNTLRTASQ